jgi:hypothetical protein
LVAGPFLVSAALIVPALAFAFQVRRRTPLLA